MTRTMRTIESYDISVLLEIFSETKKHQNLTIPSPLLWNMQGKVVSAKMSKKSLGFLKHGHLPEPLWQKCLSINKEGFSDFLQKVLGEPHRVL